MLLYFLALSFLIIETNLRAKEREKNLNRDKE
jgi:hypothetical protein